MKSTVDRLVDDYLKRLDRELAGIPRGRRNELVQEITDHIADARARLEHESEAEIRTLLDRLGDPADIAAEARERVTVQPARRNWVDVLALIMLLVGGLILPVIGWFIGVVLLWSSSAWTTGEKLIGTLLVPGGLVLPLGLLVVGTSAGGCSSPVGGPLECSPSNGTPFLGVGLAIVLFLTPLLTTAFLAHRMRKGDVATAV
jgi:Protein of unknown function (DUF1700)